jgi:tetratricopeptide (TPR) repeat protein
MRPRHCVSVALNINPNYDVALRNKGLSLMLLERYHEAIAIFNRALKMNPEDGRARYYKGITYARMGNNQKASPLLTDDLR